MKGESSCNPHAINHQDNHKVCIASYGLFQVGCLHFSEGQDKTDIETNIAVAYKVWKSQGYRAWTVYTSGKYLQFM
jgi:hypothetical protein